MEVMVTPLSYFPRRR